jgi:hypothetical protein
VPLSEVIRRVPSGIAIEYVKIDAQGCDLEVIKGLLLDSSHRVHVVSFEAMDIQDRSKLLYQGQPTLDDIRSFLESDEVAWTFVKSVSNHGALGEQTRSSCSTNIARQRSIIWPTFSWGSRRGGENRDEVKQRKGTETRMEKTPPWARFIAPCVCAKPWSDRTERSALEFCLQLGTNVPVVNSLLVISRRHSAKASQGKRARIDSSNIHRLSAGTPICTYTQLVLSPCNGKDG